MQLGGRKVSTKRFETFWIFPVRCLTPATRKPPLIYSRERRRMLYYGPTKRRTGIPIRVLFTLLPPAPDDPPETAETVIFLLRLLHGPQRLVPEDPGL